MTDKLNRSNPVSSPAAALEEVFLTERQLASRHQLSVKTLRNARVTGSYICFVRLGRTVRYRLSDVIAYEEAHLVRSTSDRQTKREVALAETASEARTPALLIIDERAPQKATVRAR